MSSNMMSMNSNSFPGSEGHTSLSFPVVGGPIEIPSLHDYSVSRHESPDSLSPNSPAFPQAYGAEAYPTQGPIRSHMGSNSQGQGTMAFGGQNMSYHPSTPMTSSPPVRREDEVRRLRLRVHELEREVNQTKSAMATMRNSTASNSTIVGGLPTPPHSAAFQSSWRARTEARKRIFCSLNRAGNALCAWHDSRRERRAYPPRNAPPGFLNCGCTYDEALFEESLSRHGVGSYLPGETVRMDPALRNPLLKLLQDRYGYKDGDFEHNPVTESWAEGESPSAWEKKAQGGIMVKRRTDTERH